MSLPRKLKHAIVRGDSWVEPFIFQLGDGTPKVRPTAEARVQVRTRDGLLDSEESLLLSLDSADLTPECEWTDDDHHTLVVRFSPADTRLWNPDNRTKAIVVVGLETYDPGDVRVTTELELEVTVHGEIVR